MKPADLLVRCYAEKRGGHWQAICLDFDLAAQADSFPAVRQKMNAMIIDFVYDAVVGEDKAHCKQLLSRRAPLKYWVKYLFFQVLAKMMDLNKEMRMLFKVFVLCEDAVVGKYHHA